MKKNEKLNFGIFFIIIIALIFFNIKNADAASTHVCEWTNDNNFCVESTDENFKDYGGCKSGYKDSFTSLDQVENCKRGTCVPTGQGGCLSNKFKIECIANNSGRWFDQPLNNVPDCQIGCCNVANSLCGLQQKKVCVQDIAKGNANAYTASITDAAGCDNSCKTADKGCCKSGDSFRWTTRNNCKADFFANTNCRNVLGYSAISHKYKSCGDNTEDDDKFDVYWYDSNNVREDIALKCDYPNQLCSDKDGKGGIDAECVSTSCVDDCPDCIPGQFRTGESVCLNTLETFYGNDKRSTGLHNYVLRCQWGQVTPQDNDNNRNKKCVETVGNDGRINAKYDNNNYANCASCGQGSTTDIAGFVPIIGPPISAGLLLIGNSCGKNGWDLGLGESCSDKGDCKYDADFIWTPIGSCNPKFTPGNTEKCNECGKGGDSATNLCTKKECNSLGDCQFHQKTLTSESLVAAGGLALGTCATGYIASSIFCETPIVGQASCPGWLAGAKTLCTKVGSHNLFWGLIGLVYGVGALTATEDTQQPDKILVDGKVPIGIALVAGNYLLSKIPDQELATLQIGEPEKGVSSLDVAKTTSATLSVLGAAHIKQYLIDGFVKVFSYGPIPDSFSIFLIKKGLVDKLMTSLMFVSTAVSFQTGTCTAEQPLTTNSFCETCGAGEGQWFCTKQRCNILGAENGNCRFFPTNGTAYGKCLAIPSNDNTPPALTKIKASFLDDTSSILKESSRDGKSLNIEEKLGWNIISMKLNVNTDEKSSCTFSSLKGTDFIDGLGFDEDGYGLEHSIELNISESNKINGLTFYFKCEDLNGNKIDKTDDSNFISLKFEARPDTTPPTIQKINPRNSILLPASKNNIDLSVIVYDNNDIEECKYTKSNNTNYNEFENTFTRGNKIGCQTTTKDDCREFTTNLELTPDWGKDSALNNRKITSYSLNINCKDTQGNIGFEPQSWTMFTTELFNLTINSPTENEQLFNRRPLINVTTSEATICNYTINGKKFTLDNKFDFEHLKIHDENLAEGSYNLKIECNDIAGNEVVEERNFQVLIDNKASEITKLYKTQGKLCIQLNEEAECRYENKAIFPQGWENGNGMVDGSLKNSKCATLDQNKIYYIMCRDTWDNDLIATIYP